MSLINIILTIVIMTLFCAGFRVLISDGQILHFIRKPFEFENSKMMNFLKNRLRQRVLISTENAYELKKKYEKISAIISIWLKPLLLCVICFSSIWGGSVFTLIHGFHPLELIICCVSSAFLLKLISDNVEF